MNALSVRSIAVAGQSGRGHLQTSLRMSGRRAYRIVGVDRKSVGDRSVWPDDADLRERLPALAAERWRFGYAVSFTGRMRDELLNEKLYMSLDHARTAIAARGQDYNEARPHSALGYETPATFAAKLNKQWLAALRPSGSAPQAIASTVHMRNNHGQAPTPAGGNQGVRSLSEANQLVADCVLLFMSQWLRDGPFCCVSRGQFFAE